jgi:hypothetical protein
VIQATVRFSEGSMAFVRNTPRFLVKRHGLLFAGSLQI